MLGPPVKIWNLIIIQIISRIIVFDIYLGTSLAIYSKTPTAERSGNVDYTVLSIFNVWRSRAWIGAGPNPPWGAPTASVLPSECEKLLFYESVRTLFTMATAGHVLGPLHSTVAHQNCSACSNFGTTEVILLMELLVWDNSCALQRKGMDCPNGMWPVHDFPTLLQLSMKEDVISSDSRIAL